MKRSQALVFLGVTFGLSYGAYALVLAGAPLPGYRYGLLFVPALAALIAAFTVGKGNRPEFRIWPLPWPRVIRVALFVPAVFTIVHVANTALGLQRPDWGLGELMALLPPPDSLGIPDEASRLTPLVFLIAGGAVSVVLGPTLSALFMAATEYGWRAFLLPCLAPVGRRKAAWLSGLLWALSLPPLLLGRPGGFDPTYIAALVALMTVFGAFLGLAWFRTRHLGFSAVCCGCLMSQTWGIWAYLFPSVNVRAPFGGTFGLVSIGIWIVALALLPLVVEGARCFIKRT